MKVIVKDTEGKIKHGKGALAEGAPIIMLVDEQGSRVIRDGVLYVDGQPAPTGTVEIPIDEDDSLMITVDKRGKAKHTLKGRVKNG